MNAERLAHVARRASGWCFVCFLVLALGAHSDSLQTGPFTWLPLLRLTPKSGQSAAVGVLALLPVGWVAGWGLALLLGRKNVLCLQRRWDWGRASVTLPLAALSVWMFLRLANDFRHADLKALVSLGLFWLTYFYLIAERPPVATALAFVVALQGAVAVAQVYRQSDLGLAWLGELHLDPRQGGVIVLVADGQRWLRGYGLTGGPNTLGASLAVLIAFLLPAAWRVRGWRLWAYCAVLSLGVLGWLASFSRSSWLALGAGLAIAAAAAGWQWRRHGRGRGFVVERRTVAAMAIPLALGGLFLLAHTAALNSRFVQLDAPLEARSLHERARDANLALRLIREQPLVGVGVGRVEQMVKTLDPQALVVHNVPLLVAAETGMIGAALWLWLTLAGLWTGYRRSPWLLALWIVTVILGLFGPWWLTISWRAGLLFALALATLAREDDPFGYWSDG